VPVRRQTPTRRAIGQRAEDAVAAHLEAQGFVILFRNLRLGALEIDLVARRGPLVAIVEVRARGRGSFTGPFASITPKKRGTLVRAAERLWSGTLRGMQDVERVRIDVAAVTIDGEQMRLEYAQGAITA
jgi:putative endonuclease